MSGHCLWLVEGVGGCRAGAPPSCSPVCCGAAGSCRLSAGQHHSQLRLPLPTALLSVEYLLPCCSAVAICRHQQVLGLCGSRGVLSACVGGAAMLCVSSPLLHMGGGLLVWPSVSTNPSQGGPGHTLELSPLSTCQKRPRCPLGSQLRVAATHSIC